MLFFAASASAAGASIAQGFKTTETNLLTGALMSVRKDAPDMVELVTPQRAERLAGVMSDNPLISVSDSTSSVQVITEGTTPALVSDINGAIKAGDRIGVSTIKGIGMKATQSGAIVGIAQTDFAGGSATERTITGADGKSRTVHIGLVSVRVGVAAYVADQHSSQAPALLQDLANNVAGRSVSVVRVLFATLLLLLLFVTVAMLLYGAVRASIISIGRNPLSEAILRKSLSQVGLTAGVVTAVGLASIYLILRV
jgi:hypothetical protein